MNEISTYRTKGRKLKKTSLLSQMGLALCGKKISLKRLDARPIATLSVEAQERHERRERDHRDD